MPSPLPVNLPQECRKAAKIFSQFADPNTGLDSLVPPSILRRAKGFCFMSVAKAGFVFSVRAGSGVVIVKLPDGSWSAPSAVGTAGGGAGFQVGVEIAEFLIILNSRKAVKSFMAKGSLTLGGNMSIAAGPLGRNIEGTGTLSSKGAAAMYSYSRSKGLFGGASVEGSIIVERSDANSKAYGYNVTAKQLLSGAVDSPSFADPLIETIIRLTTAVSRIPGWIDDPPSGDCLPLSDSDSDPDDDYGHDGGRSSQPRRSAATVEQDRDRPYAFGTQFASGGSKEPAMSVATADKERSRIGSMLGSVGRTRSGSGGSGGGAAGKKDPFATPIGSTTNFGSGNGNGNGNATTGFGGESRSGGPVAGGAARFETSFSHPSDSEEGEFAIHKPTTTATRPSRSHSSSSKPPPLSRDPSFSQPAYSPPLTSPSLASSVRGKLTKPRSGSANSAGLRERAAGMNWGSSAGPGFPASPAEVARRTAGGGRGDDFDDDEDERGEGGLRGAYDGLGEDEWGKSSFGRIAPSKGFPGPPEMEVREKEKEKEKKGIMRRFRSSSGSSSRKNDEGDLSGASAFDTAASPAFAKPKSRLRSSTLPSSSAKQKNKQPSKSPFDDGFDDDASSLSSIDYPPISTSSPTSAAAQDRPNLNRALSKPWDSEDESYFSPPQPSFSARSPPLSQNDSSSSPRTPGGHSLDLRQVEADFATVMDLSRNGGEGEVGSYTLGGRSRSSTVTAAGGRSRSSTVTAGAAGGEGKFRPPGVGKGGIGWATALFDFPGVETTDLPFSRLDTLLLLSRDDDEWWRARKGVREGMVPRNYLEAHFD